MFTHVHVYWIVQHQILLKQKLSKGTLSYVGRKQRDNPVAIDANSNDTYCEYDTHGFIELSYVDTSTYSVGADRYFQCNKTTGTPFSSAGTFIGAQLPNVSFTHGW